MTVAPAARAASATFCVLPSMSVRSMTSATAPCRTPPSVVKSFWYSISTTAVVFGSMAMVGSFVVARVCALAPNANRGLRHPQGADRLPGRLDDVGQAEDDGDAAEQEAQGRLRHAVLQ